MTSDLTTAMTASSADGRTFTFEGFGTFPVVPGDLVVLHLPDGSQALGQVLDCRDPADPNDGGEGVVLGVLDGDVPRAADRRPFAAATMRPASQAHLEQLQGSAGGALDIGSWRSAGQAVPALLKPHGFNRHTFLCGQSGSGKTYALGVILERLLLGTELRMVVLDPNADFVKLGEARADAPPEVAKRLADLDVRVLRASATGGEPLRLRFSTMPRAAQAAMLQLDPLVDRAEYNLLLHLMKESSSADLGQLIKELHAGGPDHRALAQRIENLGFPEWEVWAGQLPSAAETVASGPRATVCDLSGFSDPLESLAVSLDLIERLWADRESRTPTLIVIDEAHNLCPAEPSGTLQTALVDRLVQIAAEGRKYGLWLLLSTQRPSKLHPQVLSQCDNLALMRMNSPGDVVELASVFGFAPEAMLRASPFFMQGEALFAGNFVPTPSTFTMGGRFTVEGGSDVRVPLSSG